MRIRHIVKAPGAAVLAHEQIVIDLYRVCSRYRLFAVLALDHTAAFINLGIVDIRLAFS
jgi:hypothetical protein